MKYVVKAIQVYGNFGRRLESPVVCAWEFDTKKEAKEFCNTFKNRPAYSKAWME